MQIQASLKNQSKEPKVLASKIPRKSVLELRELAKIVTTIDLCFISIAAYKINSQQKDNTISSISLYEIDRELQDRQECQEAIQPTRLPGEQQKNKIELQWL